jgi:hypothetical protein
VKISSIAKLVFFGMLLGVGLGSARADEEIRANYVVTVADDFVVDVYLNGRLVPESRRHLTEEVFGATREKIDIKVTRGDWIVFHVVNDRMRWGGAYYFAAAGMINDHEAGFVSSLSSGDWSACGDPSDTNRFIEDEGFTNGQPVEKISRLWTGGVSLMKKTIGESWNGDPIWGRTQDRDVWLKMIAN